MAPISSNAVDVSIRLMAAAGELGIAAGKVSVTPIGKNIKAAANNRTFRISFLFFLFLESLRSGYSDIPTLYKHTTLFSQPCPSIMPRFCLQNPLLEPITSAIIEQNLLTPKQANNDAIWTKLVK